MSSRKYILAVATISIVAATLMPSCKEKKHYHDYFDRSQIKYIATLGKKPQLEDRHEQSDTTIVDKNGLHRINAYPPAGKFQDIFVDYNDVQIPHARRNGIEPIKDFHDAYHLRQPLVKIETCETYFLDSLTHSMPYLVPKAAKLLEDIGCEFADTVKARGGSAYRIVVTSCTRSNYTVSKLVKVNRNASPHSCHFYGTTIDLSWVHFEPYNNDFLINAEDLKNVLGEILYKYQQNKRCTVLFERGQCCFHLTVI